MCLRFTKRKKHINLMLLIASVRQENWFYPTLQANKFAFYFFMDAGRRHETSRSETKNVTSNGTQAAWALACLHQFPMILPFHGDEMDPQNATHATSRIHLYEILGRSKKKKRSWTTHSKNATLYCCFIINFLFPRYTFQFIFKATV